MKANSVQSSQSQQISGADVLALGLEITGLAAISIWGWHTLGWTGAITSPLVLVVFWGMCLSPRAGRPITGLAWPAAKLAVYFTCALAMHAVAGPLAAASFLALALLSTTLGGSR